MNPDWRRTLEGAGARLDGGRVADFGDPRDELAAAASGGVVADLSHLGHLRIEGADAEGFLQAQLTNDVAALPVPGSQLAAWCSAQGRVLASMLVLRGETAFHLLLPGELVPGVRNRLSMFVLRADVGIEDEGGASVRLGLAGDAAASCVAGIAGRAPEHAGECVEAGGLTVARLAGGDRPRFVVVGAPEAAGRLWDTARDRLRPVGAPAWDLVEVDAGIPWVGTRTADAFLPQMLGLVELDAVSFTKGCYPGQEVVARTQHRGSVKRHLRRAHSPAEPPPEPGDEIRGGTERNGERAGSVLAAAPDPGGGTRLLVVLQDDAAGAPLRLPGRGGAAVALVPPPGAGRHGSSAV